MPLGLVLIAGGVLLIVAGVKGQHPWAPIVSAFGGAPPPPPGETSATAGGWVSGASGAVASGLGDVAGAVTGTLAGAAKAILAAGRWPDTPDNLAGLSAWIACEKPPNEPWQWNNPLNTEQDHGFGGSPAYGAVLGFPDQASGAKANAATILQSNFTAIAHALQQGALGTYIRDTGGNVLGNWGTNPACVSSRLATAH